MKLPSSEGVENFNVNLSEARKKFESYSTATSEGFFVLLELMLVDFRDLRQRKKASHGFIQGQKEFELADPVQKLPETPMQKFHRLQSEMKGFMEELQSLKVYTQKLILG